MNAASRCRHADEHADDIQKGTVGSKAVPRPHKAMVAPLQSLHRFHCPSSGLPEPGGKKDQTTVITS